QREWVEDKQKRKKQKRIEKRLKATKATEDEAAEEEKEVDDTDARTIAVDWALSKDKWEEEKAKLQVKNADDEDTEMQDISGSESGSDTDASGHDEFDSDVVGVHEGTSDEDGEGDEGEGGDENEHGGRDKDDTPVKPELPPPDAGTTLFVRNVPFTATEDELRTLFRSFGPLRYARITIDPETGRSRGTGFACFWNKEDADKAIEQSELLKMETMGPQETVQAGKLREEGEKRRPKADKRNMYLLREGGG
ncbi:hypothetical protein MPER_05028, partial [Moniliophthora perniciosa FA553]